MNLSKVVGCSGTPKSGQEVKWYCLIVRSSEETLCCREKVLMV